jgi:phage gpG-like protein
MAGLQLSARDLPRLEAIFGRLERRMVDTSPLMSRIGQAVEGDIEERFQTETAPDGGRWAPSIRAREEGGKTLTASARLRQSMTHNVRGRDEVEVGTNLIYAGVHQDGSTIRGGSGPLRFRLPGGLGFRSPEEVVIPARPFLGVSRDGEAEILAQAEDYLAEMLP